MRLLILGASGGCGQWASRIAAARGHRVTAQLRSTAPSTPTSNGGVELRRADPTDPASLDELVRGHDAVISCLGLRRAGKSPWAALRSPSDLTATVARALVPAMERHGVRRLVAISAAGVAESIAQLGTVPRWLVSRGNVAVAYHDLARMEALLAASTLDWIVARPVTLIDGPPTGRARAVARYTLTSTIRRSDVATWLVDAAERPGVVAERRVMIG